jgi:hypothetical protein
MRGTNVKIVKTERTKESPAGFRGRGKKAGMVEGETPFRQDSLTGFVSVAVVRGIQIAWRDRPGETLGRNLPPHRAAVPLAGNARLDAPEKQPMMLEHESPV